MKKYIYIILIAIIVALSTTLIIVVIKNKDKPPEYPEWEEPEVEYFFATAEYGDLWDVTLVNGFTDVNLNYTEEYALGNVSINDVKVKEGDIVPKDFVFHATIKNKKLGKVEKISESNNNTTITMSSLCRQIVEIKIPQSIANDVSIGTEVEVFYNNSKFFGKIIEKGYAFDANSLLGVKVEIAENDIMLLNSNVSVKISINKKHDVLIIPKEALLEIKGEDYDKEIKKYYVDLFKNDKITRTVIEVGYDDCDYVEVKSGLSKGDKVILNGE